MIKIKFVDKKLNYKMALKPFFIIFVLFANLNAIHSQNIGFQFGSANFPEKANSKLHPDIINRKKYNSSENYFKINYEHLLKNNIFLSGSFSRYPTSLNFNFYREECTSAGVGYTGTNVNRVDFSLMYNVFSKSKFIFQPYIGLGILKSNPNGSEGGGELFGQWVEGIQPNLKVLRDVEAKAVSNLQLVPELGLKFGYAFWNRLELFIDIQGVFGHKMFQELKMSYSYKGVVQPEAINYSEGSGTFFAYGIGYRFIKSKKKK